MSTRQNNSNASGMRMLATGLLVLMALLFVAVRLARHSYPWPWLGWVQAFAEAAMVGALADWFAVTALFRHPLGLPIPHTAIISSNKDRIGNSLGEFVQSNFLSAEILGKKLEQLDAASRITAWLQNSQRTRASCEQCISIVPELLGALDDTDLRRFLRSNLSTLRQELRLGVGLSTILRALIEGDKHQQLLNEGLRLAERLLDEQQIFLRETLREELPWYVPNFVHNKVYHDMMVSVRATLHAVNQDANHPARHRFSAFIWKLIDELKTSPHMEERCQSVLGWIVESPLLANYAEAVWNQIKDMIVARLSNDSAAATNVLQQGLSGLGDALARDERIRAKLNRLIVSSSQRFAQEYQEQIAALITDTVRNWDSDTVVMKIEEQVGRDLQYIRINGTIVGGLVGLLIYAVTYILP